MIDGRLLEVKVKLGRNTFSIINQDIVFLGPVLVVKTVTRNVLD